MIHPESWAKLNIDRAGEPYRPSNGSEGELFMGAWCAACQRDKAFREGEQLDGCDDNEVCAIIGASFRGEAKEWVYGADGQPKCTAFVPAGQPIPAPRCDKTPDMFGGPEGSEVAA
ncbi:hypothetical protein P3G55_17375 [Leptospira sp. 96542]|nr:hypothetical protein [Leptospira sp. 96542]